MFNSVTSSPSYYSTDGDSCRYSQCLNMDDRGHSYSHTLQYFPNNPEEQKTKTFYNGNALNSSFVFPYVTGKPTSEEKHRDERFYSYDKKKGKEKRKMGNHQRRCWNTANYQWMSIKRERKISCSGSLIPTILLFIYSKNQSFLGKRSSLYGKQPPL